MINPCVDFCYRLNGKEYSEECDHECVYAAEVKRRKMLESRMTNALSKLDSVIIEYRSCMAEASMLNDSKEDADS